MKTSDILRDAKSLLNEQSWVSRPPDLSGEECALSALSHSEGEFCAIHGAYGALVRALPEGYTGVVSFNDDPETTLTDVLALYDRAIATCETDGD